MRLTFAATLLAGAVAFGGGVQAQQLDKKEFNVIGTWNFLTPWQQLEQPFWTKELPAASGGNLKGNIKSITEVNLKGTEVLRLLKQGVFDFAAALPIYVEDGGAIIEAVDIAGVARNFKMSRDMTDAWMGEMQKIMKERHGSHILSTFTWPEQDFYCKGDIKSIEDLKGKKIRVQGTSQADLAKALGASAVTIAFGEVVPALEKGVVDCGITGTMPAYKAKWPEVTNTLFRLPVGFTVGIWVVNLNSWNKLSPDTRAFLEKQFKALEDKSWKNDRGRDRGRRRLHDRPGRHLLGGRARQAQAGEAVGGRPQGARQGAERRRSEGLGQALRRRLRGQVDRDHRQEVRPGSQDRLTSKLGGGPGVQTERSGPMSDAHEYACGLASPCSRAWASGVAAR